MLPHRGELLYTELDPMFVEDVMGMMMENGSLSTPILNKALFLSKFKLMINIIHQWYFGLLGSFDQVSKNQQMLLADLDSDKEISWERSFISQLIVDQKVFLRENRMKLGGNVSSIVLEALKGHEVIWYNYAYVPSKNMMLQSDELALHHIGLKIPVSKISKEISIQEWIRWKKELAKAVEYTKLAWQQPWQW